MIEPSRSQSADATYHFHGALADLRHHEPKGRRKNFLSFVTVWKRRELSKFHGGGCSALLSAGAPDQPRSRSQRRRFQSLNDRTQGKTGLSGHAQAWTAMATTCTYRQPGIGQPYFNLIEGQHRRSVKGRQQTSSRRSIF
jgi:hypothetical protein